MAFLGGAGQGHGKAAPSAGSLGQGDGSLVQEGQLPGDAKAQAEMLLMAAGVIRLEKPVEDKGAQLWGDAAAFICDLDR